MTEYEKQKEWIRDKFRETMQSECEQKDKQIADLTEENNKLRDVINNQDVKIADLEQQIEKMKCCSNCKNEGDYKEPYRYGTGWCNICKRHKVAKGNFDKWEIKRMTNEVKENAELKSELTKKADTNHSLVEQMADLESENAELKKELNNWKDEWQEQVQKAIDEGWERTQQTIQLTKAKEIIGELNEGLDKLYLSGLSAKQIAFVEQLQDKAEQFLKEIKK